MPARLTGDRTPHARVHVAREPCKRPREAAARGGRRVHAVGSRRLRGARACASGGGAPPPRSNTRDRSRRRRGTRRRAGALRPADAIGRGSSSAAGAEGPRSAVGGVHARQIDPRSRTGRRRTGRRRTERRRTGEERSPPGTEPARRRTSDRTRSTLGTMRLRRVAIHHHALWWTCAPRVRAHLGGGGVLLRGRERFSLGALGAFLRLSGPMRAESGDHTRRRAPVGVEPSSRPPSAPHATVRPAGGGSETNEPSARR